MNYLCVSLELSHKALLPGLHLEQQEKHMNDEATIKRKAGTLLIYFTVFVLLLSACLKLAHVAPIAVRGWLLGFGFASALAICPDFYFRKQ